MKTWILSFLISGLPLVSVADSPEPQSKQSSANLNPYIPFISLQLGAGGYFPLQKEVTQYFNRINPLIQFSTRLHLSGAFPALAKVPVFKQLSLQLDSNYSYIQAQNYEALPIQQHKFWLGMQLKYSYKIGTMYLDFGLGSGARWLWSQASISGADSYRVLNSLGVYARASTEIGLLLKKRTALGLNINYTALLNENLQLNEFNHSLNVSGVFHYRFQKPKPHLTVQKIELDPLYVAHREHHATHKIGYITLKNETGTPLTKLKVSSHLSPFFDTPMDSRLIPVLQQNQTILFELAANLNDDVLALSETRNLTLTFTLSYFRGEHQYTQVERKSITLYPRNAMHWDDLNKFASFITPLDDPIQELSSRWVRSVTQVQRADQIPQSLLPALALFEGLGLQKIEYVHDPTSVAPGNQVNLDYIRYPREVLQEKVGDCDDLTALYISLLEAIGIETVYIVVPGHIFMMFNTGIKEENYHIIHSDLDKIIFYRSNLKDLSAGNTVWIPIETTMIGKPFSEAWANGASAYQSYLQRDTLTLVPTRLAHQMYPPLNLSPTTFPLKLTEHQFSNRLLKSIETLADFRSKAHESHFLLKR